MSPRLLPGESLACYAFYHSVCLTTGQGDRGEPSETLSQKKLLLSYFLSSCVLSR